MTSDLRKGENRENSGRNPNLPAIRNDKDGIIIDMKLKGYSNREIAKATGMNLKTVQNIVSKGGRLYHALQSLRADKVMVLKEGSLSVWDKLLATKEPAIDELRSMALEEPNPIVRFKAIEKIIGLTGIRDDDMPPLLDPLDMDKSVEKLIKWANLRIRGMYQDRAPVISLWVARPEAHFEFSKDDVTRLEKLISEMKALNNQKHIISGCIQHGEPIIEGT